MKKLDVIKHYLMPFNKECELILTQNEYTTYILGTRNNIFYYEITICPYVNTILLDVETLEDLLTTNASFFTIKMKDIQGYVVEDIYTHRELTSNYQLN